MSDRSSEQSPDEQPDEKDVRQPQSLESGLLSWRTLVSFSIAIAILVFVVRGMDIDLDDTWKQIRQANVAMFLGALLIFYMTFYIRAIRWTMMLDQAGINARNSHPIPGKAGMFEIITLSWFANSVLPARLGDAYRCYLIKQRANASFGVSLGTILAERLIDLVVLVTVLLGSGLIVFGTHAPDKAQSAFIGGGLVVIVGLLGVGLLWLLRDQIDRFMPQRIARHYSRVQVGLFASLARPLPPAAISVVIWLCDGLRVYLISWSLGQHISYPAAIVVALISALVSIIPITPAGLGFVEGFMVTALNQIKVPTSTAAAIALLDRVVTYLSLIVVGIPLYLWMVKREIGQPVEDTG